MNGTEFLENINYLDDDLISGAENWVYPHVHKKRYIIGAAALTACLCLTVGLTVNYYKTRNIPSESGVSLVKDSDPGLNGGDGVLPGMNEIYPTIMVNGTLYEWRFGVAVIDEMPAGSAYYGKIRHIDKKTPEKDREMVSVFDASGGIFIDPDQDLVYLELTTDWLTKQLIIFEPQATSERYLAELALQSENGDIS